MPVSSVGTETETETSAEPEESILNGTPEGKSRSRSENATVVGLCAD